MEAKEEHTNNDHAEDAGGRNGGGGIDPVLPDEVRIYVGNLPNRVSKGRLEEEFGRVANIKKIQIPRNGKYAFVDVETQEVAERVISELNGFVLEGSALRVELGNNAPRRGDKKGDRKTARTQNRIIITGLGSNTSWQDLKDVMRDIGGDVTFTSIKNGEGFAEFSSEGDVDKAIEKLDGTVIAGHRVTVRRDDQPDRDLERDQPGKKERRRDRRRGRRRSRSPERRRRDERRRSRGRRSPDDRSRRRDRDRDRERDRDSGRRRRASPSSGGSRSPPRRRHRSRSR